MLISRFLAIAALWTLVLSSPSARALEGIWQCQHGNDVIAIQALGGKVIETTPDGKKRISDAAITDELVIWLTVDGDFQVSNNFYPAHDPPKLVMEDQLSERRIEWTCTEL